MSRIDEYRRCAAAGMSKSETAEHCGVTRRSVGKAAKRHGIEFVLWRDKPEVRQVERDGQIMATGGVYDELRKLAARWGLPEARVRARYLLVRT